MPYPSRVFSSNIVVVIMHDDRARCNIVHHLMRCAADLRRDQMLVVIARKKAAPCETALELFALGADQFPVALVTSMLTPGPIVELIETFFM